MGKADLTDPSDENGTTDPSLEIKPHWDATKLSQNEMWTQKRRLATAMRLVIERLVPSNAPTEELAAAAEGLEYLLRRRAAEQETCGLLLGAMLHGEGIEGALQVAFLVVLPGDNHLRVHLAGRGAPEQLIEELLPLLVDDGPADEVPVEACS